MHFLKCHVYPALYHPKQPVILKDVIVSLTTTPPRIHRIWPTINAICMQSCLPEQIHIWLPQYYKRFNTGISRVPWALQNHPFITVHRIQNDYGPATKVLPAIQLFQHEKKHIIVIDDDRIYAPRFIEYLYQATKQFPDEALTLFASDVKNGQRIKYCRHATSKKVDILHGYGGYLVQPNFFTSAVFNPPAHLTAAFFQDDVWLSGCLKQHNIPIRRLARADLYNWQQLLLPNICGGKRALCRTENQTEDNFLQTWDYFADEIKQRAANGE